MNRLFPRLRLILSLVIALLAGGITLWVVADTLINRAWKAAYLRNMVETVQSIAHSVRVPATGKWSIQQKGGIKVVVVNLTKGRSDLNAALKQLHLHPDVAPVVLFRDKGAVCVDRSCRVMVAGVRMYDRVNHQAGVVLMVESGTVLYRLVRFNDMIWLVTLVLVGLSAFLLGYLLLYLWQVKPYLELMKEIDRLKPILKDTGGPKRPGNALEILARVRKAYGEERSMRKRLEMQAREVREDLLSAQESLLRSEKLASVGVLAAGLAHEIGNPVGIIMGLSELMTTEDASPEEIREYAQSILKSVKRVHKVIQDLLTFARPVKDENEKADVVMVVRDAVALLQPQSSFRNVQVNVDLPDKPVFAEIKPSQLQQVIVNLMLNAADAMHGKGVLNIFVGSKDGRVSITVQDTGPGIPEDVLSRIWEPFFTTKDVGKGTGLGLPMSLRIVNAYGGDIRVSTKPGEGTDFTVYLWEVEE